MKKGKGICRACKNQLSPIPIGIAGAMEVIVDHYWNDEARDYRATPTELRDSHIFTNLEVLRTWLYSGFSEEFEDDEWEYF